MSEISTLHLRIEGRVQGVGFRYSMAIEATRLGVTGWVRNRRDGSVEALVCGSSEQLAKIREWAQHGPPAAHVTAVCETPVANESHTAFVQLST